jgi:hypothetical protein
VAHDTSGRVRVCVDERVVVQESDEHKLPLPASWARECGLTFRFAGGGADPPPPCGVGGLGGVATLEARLGTVAVLRGCASEEEMVQLARDTGGQPK